MDFQSAEDYNFSCMRTVGQILKEAREAKFYTLEEIEKATKIRKELLAALEADNYAKLPPPTFVQGFIKNYARFLNLDSNKLLAIFRREFSDRRHKPYVMNAFANPLDKTKISITPTRALGLLVVVVIVSFFAYLWIQYRQFIGAPNLSVTSPVDQLAADNATVVVEGKTDPEVKLTINSQDIQVDPGGNFKEDLTLSAPVNKVIIIAISKFGQRSEVDRTVYFKGK